MYDTPSSQLRQTALNPFPPCFRDAPVAPEAHGLKIRESLKRTAEQLQIEGGVEPQEIAADT